MRYYNNLNQFEEIRSFKRFYSEDPIPGVDVIVEKVPPGSAFLVGYNVVKESIEETYGVTVRSNDLTTSQKKLQRFNIRLEDSTKFSKDEFDLNLTNLAKTINQNAIALSYVMNEISGGVGGTGATGPQGSTGATGPQGETGATGSFSFDCDFEHTNCFSGMQLLNVGTFGSTFSFSGSFATSSSGSFYNGIVYDQFNEFGITYSIVSYFDSADVLYQTNVSEFGVLINSINKINSSSTQIAATEDSISIGKTDGVSQTFIQIDENGIEVRLGTSSNNFLVSDYQNSPLLNVDGFGNISFNSISQIGGTVGYPDDATAASNGIILGGIYHDNGILKIRVI
jgi:hypothetical protein